MEKDAVEKEPTEIVLVLRCHGLPGAGCLGGTGARLGLQKGREVCDDAPATGEEIVFKIPLRIKWTAGGSIDFAGPFVQGKSEERFIYLTWGERQEAGWEMNRRAKFPLNVLTPRLAARSATQKLVEVVLQMTDSRGHPLCATIPEQMIEWRV